MSSELKFVINPSESAAPFSLLVKSLDNIQKVLRAVDRTVNGAHSDNEWIVRNLASSAPTIALEATNNGFASRVFCDGIKQVVEGTDQPPAWYSEQALVALKRTNRLFSGRRKARSMDVFLDNRPVATIELGIAHKVDRILATDDSNLGSLEGTLEIINVHSRPSITLWERMSRMPVRCTIPDDPGWIQRAKALLNKRVWVSGRIHYFAGGRPRYMAHVTKITDATPNSDLPKAGLGSIPDLQVNADGTVEWLERIREA